VCSTPTSHPDQQRQKAAGAAPSRKLREAISVTDGISFAGGSKNEPAGKLARKDPRNPSNAQLTHMYGAYGLCWDGTVLRRRGRRAVLGLIERDQTFPWLWRVRLPSGRVTDLLNRTRARDLACATAVAVFDLVAS
jgi:hypothetical protein